MYEFATRTQPPHPVQTVRIHRLEEGRRIRSANGLRTGRAILARTLILAVTVLAIAGCSTRQAYYSLQEMEQSRCVDWPAHLYRDCLAASDATYPEYQAAREQARDSSD